MICDTNDLSDQCFVRPNGLPTNDQANCLTDHSLSNQWLVYTKASVEAKLTNMYRIKTPYNYSVATGACGKMTPIKYDLTLHSMLVSCRIGVADDGPALSRARPCQRLVSCGAHLR